MAVTDPTAIAFSDSKVRPLANLLGQLYYYGQAIIDEYNARGGTAFIANDANEVIEDGANTEARPVINGQDVTRIGQIMTEILTMLEANDDEKLNWLLNVTNRVPNTPHSGL